MNAPLPVFTSIARPCSPAASFFDRMLAVMSGTLSTVAVTSRMPYSRLSAGARSAVWPMMAHPTFVTTLRNFAIDGAAT